MDIINLTKGEKVIYNDKEVIITKLNTLDTVTIEELSTGTNHLVHIRDLKPIFKKKEKLDDINVISEEKLQHFIEVSETINNLIAEKKIF